MASVIPKSQKNTLAAIFPPSIPLGMLPKPLFPPFVSQSYLKASSDLLIITVSGRLAVQDPLLLVSLHVPWLPSAKDNDTGTLASFTIVAHPETINAEIIKVKVF